MRNIPNIPLRYTQKPKSDSITAENGWKYSIFLFKDVTQSSSLPAPNFQRYPTAILCTGRHKPIKWFTQLSRVLALLDIHTQANTRRVSMFYAVYQILVT
jgi:hypothetical protein